MRQTSSLNILFGITLILVAAACNQKQPDTNSGETAQRVDTVYVVDTVYLNQPVTQTIPENTEDSLISPTTDSSPYAFVSADKMNVFYIGVSNPIRLKTGGVDPDLFTVSTSGGGSRLVPAGRGSYEVTVSQPGDVNVIVSGPGGLRYTEPFRAKRIPDPLARLSSSSGGAMGSGEFKAQGGVGAFLDNFDFDAVCGVSGFTLVYLPRRQDPIESINAGARYTDASRRLIQLAKPGDIYYFENIRAKCPGDEATRKINSMVFKIK